MPEPLEPRAQVRNASDREQVKRAERVERRRAEMFRASLEVVLQTAEGRLVIWGLLAKAGIYSSIWHPSAQIHYNAGRQDFGHELLADVVATNEDLYELMEREARARQRRENRETDAAHTPRADQGDAQ